MTILWIFLFLFIYLFIYLFILIIFDVLLLKVGNTSVNISNVQRATGLSVAYTVVCYPREINKVTYLLLGFTMVVLTNRTLNYDAV